MMKRIFSLALALIILALPLSAFISCDTSIGGDVKTLYVYNWGEYISDGSEGTLDSNRAFELWYEYKYGERINVVYSTYSSNEDMYAKLSGGAVNYDIIVPSDYMIERLISAEGGSMLAELDLNNIPHASNLSSDFFGDDAKYYAYNENGEGKIYSIPYFYGMIGIIYNPHVLFDDGRELSDEEKTWDIMWDPAYTGNILQFNNSRDAFGTAQYKLGIDVNTTSDEEWERALAALKEQKSIVQGYVMDEIFNKMEGGSAGIAAYYAGDYLTMFENNEDLEFFYPKRYDPVTEEYKVSTNLYVDAMCIPADSENKTEAERYIDFMLMVDEDFENATSEFYDCDFYEFYSGRMGGEEFYSAAVANAEYTYYASPNQKVREDEGYKESMNEIKPGAYDLMYDEAALANATSYKNLPPEKLTLINTLWERLKSDIDVSPVIIIICVVIMAFLAGGGLFLGLRKKFRNNY